MKEAFRNWAFALLLVLIALSIWKASTLIPEPLPSRTLTNSASPTPTDLSGCYVNWNDTNKYTLKILTFEDRKFTAFVGYYNDGFDSSSGNYVGSFNNQILDGIYSFSAEGTENKRELVFKYVDNEFIAGFGKYKVVDGVELLTSITNVKWFEKYTYSPATDCNPPE